MHVSALLGAGIGALEPQTTAVNASSSGKYEEGAAIFSNADSKSLS